MSQSTAKTVVTRLSDFFRLPTNSTGTAMERDYQGIPGKSLVIPSKIGKIVESRKGVAAFFPI